MAEIKRCGRCINFCTLAVVTHATLRPQRGLGGGVYYNGPRDTTEVNLAPQGIRKCSLGEDRRIIGRVKDKCAVPKEFSPRSSETASHGVRVFTSTTLDWKGNIVGE